MSKETLSFVTPPPKNYKISSAFSYNFISALTIFNLTENAVKYNRPGGSVRVSVTQELEKLLLRVSDTGCGIPEVYQRSIFQPFFRVDKSRSREYGGAGLGLSLVWEIADLHGGSVWVEKSSEKGTTIVVGLPTQQSTKP